MLRTVLFGSLGFIVYLAFTPVDPGDRPNVLWIYVEDLNPWLGCHGEGLAQTPHLDALAARGVRFERAFMPSAVCSPTRSAVITGTMQTTLGLHNHRSARAKFRGKDLGTFDAIRLPNGVSTVPELFKAAGYYTFNQGKTDYNFVHDAAAIYDAGTRGMNFDRFDLAALWRGRSADQPFFGQIQLRGGKSRVAAQVDPANVTVMPYYPDHPLVRREIAHHYDCVRRTDREVGRILQALARDDLLDKTVVFFFSDHGFRLMRHKQFLYEGGIHVPLIVAGPTIPRGEVRADLVSGIDVGPTSLALAQVAIPSFMEGRDVFHTNYESRPFVIAARDRCDYTIDRIRAVRTVRYKYLRNHLTDRPYLQPQYRDPWPVMKLLKRLHREKKLTAPQAAFIGSHRPPEELYDLENDPHELVNLAGDPAHADALERHRAILARWTKQTDDKGQVPETITGLRAVLERWADKCVNPEYDRARAKAKRQD